MDQAARGAAFLAEKKYPEAIEQYTLALRLSPTSPLYYIQRSTAYQRSSPPDYESALQDAEIAVVAATQRAKRELVTQAQMRRGICLANMNRWGDAEIIFELVKVRDPKEKMLSIWTTKCENKLRELRAEGVDDERTQVTVEQIPKVSIPTSEKPERKEEMPKTTQQESQKPETQKGIGTPAPLPAPSKVKVDWYQTTESVTVNMLVKGIPKDEVAVEIHEQSVSVTFPTPSGSDWSWEKEPLYDTIDPSNSTYKVTPNKIEFVLKKRIISRWPDLESPNKPANNAENLNDDAHLIKRAVFDTQKPTGVMYPTSSKNGPKNWDQLAAEVEDEPEGDETAGFFKKLYAGASDEVRRNMVQSYVQSAGTTLSTNAPPQKGYDISPPEGMEAKKW